MSNNPEYQLCRSISEYLQWQYPKIEFRFDMAGLNLSKVQSGMNKAIQKRRGYPDLNIMEPVNDYHGLFIEIKAGGFKLIKQNGDWVNEHIKEQADYLCDLQDKGYNATFGVGFDECKRIIDEYLGGR